MTGPVISDCLFDWFTTVTMWLSLCIHAYIARVAVHVGGVFLHTMYVGFATTHTQQYQQNQHNVGKTFDLN